MFDTDYSNSTTELLNNVRIAPLWDDLRTDVTSGNIFVDFTNPAAVRIRWVGETYSSGTPVDFSVSLYQDGNIRFDYHITHSNLSRLQRRYPRVGAQIYRNLNHVLADRMARSTERMR